MRPSAEPRILNPAKFSAAQVYPTAARKTASVVGRLSRVVAENRFRRVQCLRPADVGCRAMNEMIRRYQRELREELPLLAERYRVASLGLFGSYLHGTQRADSDLDILVTFSELPSLLRLVELENYLSDRLGVKVDLVLRDSLKPHIGERVLREVVPV